MAISKYQKKYEALRDDVQGLKKDLEYLAVNGASRSRDAFFDAADMTKNVLEADERRKQ